MEGFFYPPSLEFLGSVHQKTFPTKRTWILGRNSPYDPGLPSPLERLFRRRPLGSRNRFSCQDTACWVILLKNFMTIKLENGDEIVLLVDHYDRIVSTLSKKEAHLKSRNNTYPHRAFSVFCLIKTASFCSNRDLIKKWPFLVSGLTHVVLTLWISLKKGMKSIMRGLKEPPYGGWSSSWD